MTRFVWTSSARLTSYFTLNVTPPSNRLRHFPSDPLFYVAFLLGYWHREAFISFDVIRVSDRPLPVAILLCDLSSLLIRLRFGRARHVYFQTCQNLASHRIRWAQAEYIRQEG